MAQVQFTLTYTAADAAIAQALTDAFNAQHIGVVGWVNITVKQYLARRFKETWLDDAIRYLRTKQDAESRAELARLESQTSVA